MHKSNYLKAAGLECQPASLQGAAPWCVVWHNMGFVCDTMPAQKLGPLCHRVTVPGWNAQDMAVCWQTEICARMISCLLKTESLYKTCTSAQNTPIGSLPILETWRSTSVRTAKVCALLQPQPWHTVVICLRGLCCHGR